MPSLTTSLKPYVFITSPLESEHIQRIQAAAGDRAEVVYDAELMPPTRYEADHKGVDGFTRSPAQQARWAAHLERAEILWDFPSGPAAEGGGLAWAPKVRWVQTTSSGVGAMVAQMGLAESDLLITTARGVHADALAEFVMLCILGHAKRLLEIIQDQRAHRWTRFCGHDVVGKTMVVVGAGQVGARAAACARVFGVKTLAVVNRPAPGRAAELNADAVFGPDQLHEAIALADYLVLSTPYTPQTDKMIDARAFAAMKPGVVLINIARGKVVDEDALIENLRSGHIAFAGLDVATVEPLPENSPLWDLPNVLISPHSASTAPSENGKIASIFAHNLTAYLDGKLDDMINVLDKQRWY